MSIQIASNVFEPDQGIPMKYTGEGDDLSPELHWSDPPEGTRQWALLMEDPDAMGPEPWVHWMIYNIPTDAGSLDEGIDGGEHPYRFPETAQGRNSWGNSGYDGPMLPPGLGLHHYHFRILALDLERRLRPGLVRQQFLEAVAGHVIDEGEIVATYARH